MRKGRVCRFCGQPIEGLVLSRECVTCRVRLFMLQSKRRPGGGA